MSVSLISGASADLATVDPTSKALRVSVYDVLGNPIENREADRYVVCGATGAVCAAALAAGTTLIAMRNGAGKSLYITKIKVRFTVGTVGVSAGVAGSVKWERFTTATPTGGTARTVAKKNATFNASNVADVRDGNAALTVTSVVWTDVLDMSNVPLMITGVPSPEWVSEWEDSPAVIAPSEGISLRVLTQLAATQTWQFSYSIEWFEI